MMDRKPDITMHGPLIIKKGQLILMFTSFVRGAKNKRINWRLHVSTRACILLRIAVPNTIKQYMNAIPLQAS
jgi:hypothetical protein